MINKGRRVNSAFEPLESRLCLSAVAFVPREIVGRDQTVEAASVADFDGDGDADIFLAFSEPDRFVWYEKLDDSTAMRRHLVGGGSEIRNAFAVDMDGDGDLDVAAISRELAILTWFENDGNGRFPIDGNDANLGHVILFDKNGEAGLEMTPADVDGDGDVDLIASYTGGTNALSWFENIDGRGTFGAGKPIETDKTFLYLSLDVADIDGDGDADILASGWFYDGFVMWYENSGNGVFSRHTVQRTDATALSFPESRANDMDGDGDIDIVAWLPWDSSLVWFENTDGKGSFEAQHTIAPDASVLFTLDLSDVDGDGDVDVLTSERIESGGKSISWFENLDGRGLFGGRQVMIDQIATSVLTTADFDGDGDADVFAMTRNNSIIYLEQRTVGDVNDDGVFGSGDLIAVFQVGEYEDAVPMNSVFEEGDWNGDGEFDSADLVLAFQAGHYSVAATSPVSHFAAAVDGLFARDDDVDRRHAFVA